MPAVCDSGVLLARREIDTVSGESKNLDRDIPRGVIKEHRTAVCISIKFRYSQVEGIFHETG
jgi:hypothetical protein